ncbi:ATP-binding protein [Desulfothermus naphthae]
MILESLLKQVLIEQKELIRPSSEYILRDAIEDIQRFYGLKHIVVITGHRRAGKSVFLSQIVNKYYGMDDVYYLNLDDERLSSLKSEDMNKVLETFHILFGEKKVIFFDEIQNLEDWERFVTRLFNQGYKVYITGSNAKLLSSELATFLTGRYVDIEIFPFSFKEFLIYKKFPLDEVIQQKSFYKTEIKAKLRKLLDEYIKSGGFPEMVKYKEPSLLRTLFSDVITKDVVNRYKVKEVRTIKEIAHFLLSNSANEFSYNRIKNIYSLGSVHTVKNYVDYLTSTYMFFELSRFAHSLKEIHTKIKKIYTIDNGFIEAVAYSSSQDMGKLYENTVFIELKRRGKELYYYKDKRGREIDFIVRDKKKIIDAIQVCFDIHNDKVLKREITSLIYGLKELGLKKGTIITSDTEDKKKINGFEIDFIPLWKWLLNLG